MNRQSRWSLSSVSAIAVSTLLMTTACGDDSGPLDPEPYESRPTQLEIGTAELTLRVPASERLSALILDQRGSVMAGELVEWLSRDSTTATVSMDGTVTAEAGGVVWIVARSGGLQDSTQVTVRYHVLEGEARVRLQGAVELEEGWEPAAVFFDFLGTTDKDRFVLVMASSSTFGETLGVALILPSGPREGRTEFGELDVEALVTGDNPLELDTPTAYLIVETREALRIYGGLPGTTLDLDELRDAPGLGGEGQVGDGRLSMVATGYEVGLGGWGEPPTIIPLHDTVRVFADLSTAYLHWGVGQASFTIQGGPAPLTATGREAWWTLTRWVEEGYGVLRIEDGPPAIEVWMPAPSVGTYAIDDADLGEPPSGDERRVVARYWNESFDATGVDGSITIHEVKPSIGDLWGEVRGEVRAVLIYQDRWQATPFEPASLRLSFHAAFGPGDSWASEMLGPRAVEQGGEPAWRRLIRASPPGR